MPDDSNGVHSLPPGTIVNSGDTILPSQHNPMANDLSNGLSARFSKDGRAPATGNWSLNTFRITNLGTPTANADAATKAYVDSANPNNVYTLVAVNTAVGVADKGKWYRTVTGGIVFTPAAAATLGANHFFNVKNDSTGIVIIDPTGSETINGALTVTLNPGSEAFVICDGVAFWASIVSQQASGPDYVQGLTLSNNAADANNDIDIAVGSAKAGSRVVSLASVFTKRLDANWAAGSGNGGLDTGSKATGATYRVWPLRNTTTGVFDAIFSVSTTAAGVTVPSGYEVVAPRDFDVGMIKTDGSGNIRPFSQAGNEFLLTTSQADVDDAALGSTAKTYQLTSLPTGRKIMAKIRPSMFDDAVAAVLITSLDETDQTPSATGGPYSMINAVATGRGGNEMPPVRTDTSAQIRARAAGSSMPLTQFKIYSYGWIDYQVPRIGL